MLRPAGETHEMAKFKKPKPLYRKHPVLTETARGTPRSAHDDIEAALEQWASPPVPDYARFHNWLDAKVPVKDRTLVLPLQRSNVATAPAAYINALLNLHKTYRRKLEEANANPTVIGAAYRLMFNKYKLLIHATEALSPRTKEAFTVAQHRMNTTERLDEGLSSCSQSELRARFFAAIAHGSDRIALKLLARLREEAHDPGELEYLEALCHFHANEFTEAMHWAQKVPKDAIDFPATRAVILESLAFLSRAEQLVAELQQDEIKN